MHRPIATHGVRFNRLETQVVHSKNVDSDQPKVSRSLQTSSSFTIFRILLFALVVAALSALCHYHTWNNNEHPKRPNLALLATGAVLNATFTSPTHDVPKLGFWAKVLARGRSFDVERVKRDQPTIVFEDINLAGRCWYFTGSSGSIGVTFAYPSLVERLVLHRPDFHTLPATHLAKTPHHMILWGVLDEISTFQVLVSNDHFQQDSLRVYNGKLPSPRVLKLVELTYRIDKGVRPIQMFDVIPECRKIPFQTVILEVLDNYGGKTTCMHQVSIYGEEYNMTLL